MIEPKMRPNIQTLTNVLQTKHGRSYCTSRRLIINPSEDCRYCATYECADHPHHVDGYTMSLILSQDKVAYGRTHPSRGKKQPWDGTREDCRRYRKFGNDPVKACSRCMLDRDCKHRPKEAEWDRQYYKQRRWKKKKQKKLNQNQIDWIRKNQHRYSIERLAKMYQVSTRTIYRRLAQKESW